MTEIRSICLVALGSNLENDGITPLATLQSCLAEFRAEALTLCAVSRFFSTPCFPAGAGPDYVNAAVMVKTSLSPAEVLAALHRIEAGFRRTRTERWGMRTLDLDLLAVDQQVLPDRQTYDRWRHLAPEQQRVDAPEQLILPHPRIQDRAFVLVPLADIAPNWRHPVLGQSVAQMRAARPKVEQDEVTAL